MIFRENTEDIYAGIEFRDGTPEAEEFKKVFEGAFPKLRMTTLGPLAALEEDPNTDFELRPVADDLWVTRAPGTETWMAVTFYSLPAGERYVHLGARATPMKV